MKDGVTILDDVRSDDPEVAAVVERAIAAAHPAPRLTRADTRGPAWPAPLGVAAYHGLFGALTRTLDPQTEADPVAVLVQTLVMYGNLIGRSAHFRVGAEVHYLNLFAAIVGNTSKSRKGVSKGQAQRIFSEVDPEWVTRCNSTGLSSGEGLIWAIRDPVEKQKAITKDGRVDEYQSVIEDHGIADKRLLVSETEFASTLKVMAREGNTLSAVMRCAWDGTDLGTITKNSSARATAPHISIIGHITRDELRRYLEATDANNGFGNRFLWVCAKRSKELPDGGTAVDLAAHAETLRRVLAHARAVGCLRRDARASVLWGQVYSRLSAELPGMWGAMTARAEPQVMRLACLYALGDLSSVVAPAHLRAGLALWRYCFQSAQYLFGDRLGDPTADDILVALRRVWPDSLTRTEITHDVFKRNKTGPEMERAFTLLTNYGLATVDIDRSGDGRPVERWAATNGSLGDDINDIDDITQPGEAGSVVNVVNVVGVEPKAGGLNGVY